MRAFKFSFNDIRKISEEIKYQMGFDPLAENRIMHNVLARHCVSHILYYDYKEPHSHIGFLTGRDRTSSNHSVKYVNEQISINNEDLITLRKKIKEVFLLAEKKQIWRDEVAKMNWMNEFSESISQKLASQLSREDSVLLLRELLTKFENAEWK